MGSGVPKGGKLGKVQLREHLAKNKLRFKAGEMKAELKGKARKYKEGHKKLETANKGNRFLQQVGVGGRSD